MAPNTNAPKKRFLADFMRASYEIEEIDAMFATALGSELLERHNYVNQPIANLICGCHGWFFLHTIRIFYE